MKKLVLMVSMVVALTTMGFAQNKTGKISGTVIDGNQKTIESATIALLNAKDSTVVKYAVADKNGMYRFENIAAGKYMVSITAVGHSKGFSEPAEISDSKNEISVKTIELVPVAKGLASVTVTSKKPLIEQKIDRTIVNVEASVTNVGSSALEVLEKSPGITVDKDGNISLKGKAGVMVLVDGRPTQLGGTDLANLLRSMNATQLDQIEIMTNPPAKYDAAGNAGVINIKTKKNKQMGYNGTLSLGYGQGKYPKFNEGINFNYRKGKINVFTNLNHNYRKGFQNLDIQRNFRNEDTKEITSYFDQQARMMNEGNSYNAKVGVDYFVDKKTTLGVVVSGLSNQGDFQNKNTALIYSPVGSLQDITKALSLSNNDFKNLSTNLNYRRVLDTTGKEITADLDYLVYNTEDNNSLSNYYFNASGNTKQKGDTLYGFLPQDIQILSGKVDYLQPLKKGAKFEAGIKTSFVKTDNNAQYDTVHNGTIVRDLGRSNYFVYEENINAAYVNLSTPLSKKLNVQLGLRLENTTNNGRSTGFTFNNGTSEFEAFDTTFKNNYTQLFPTAYFQYVVNEKNNLGLNYGRRIRRPNYESLNPFIEFLDRYTYEQGNPNLKPQFSHNIELSHTFKNILTTTLNYTKTTDIIQQVIEQNTAKKETFIKQQNIADQRQYGVAVNLGMPVNKWWTSNIYVNASNNRFSGIVNGDQVTIEANMLMLNGSQQFKISKNFSAEVSGFYRTAGLEGVIKTKPMGMVSAGFSQTVLKGKGTLRLNIRDLFYTQKFQAETRYGNVDAAFQTNRDSRVANLGFTYRFTKGKMNGAPKRRAGSANDEQSRVGGGSGN